MRTTVTLEPDVAAKLKELAQQRLMSFKSALNETLRRGLTAQGGALRKRFVVEPHTGAFRSGIDPHGLNQLSDELEADDVFRKARGSK